MREGLRLLKQRWRVYKTDKQIYWSSKRQERERNIHKTKTKCRILLYHINGLSYGGTEKGLQFIAKNLDKNHYDVYYMYGEKPELMPGHVKKSDLELKKQELLSAGINLIRVDFDYFGDPPEQMPVGISPSPVQIVKALDIDLFITSTMGYASYPIPLLSCPVLMIDIFGIGGTLSNKVKQVLPISNAVKEKISGFVPENRLTVLPLPIPRPPINIDELGRLFRHTHNIQECTFVFGRLGRSDDDIFDPIAINAFERVVRSNPRDCKFVIVDPSQKLRDIVSSRHIPNVVLIEPLASEQDVWGFHGSIDVLAHSRLDGESQGLNIIESMAAGNPIISHKSREWNAHLDYLTTQFARIADIDDVEQYASHIDYFLRADEAQLNYMCQKARETFELSFGPEAWMSKLEGLFSKALLK